VRQGQWFCHPCCQLCDFEQHQPGLRPIKKNEPKCIPVKHAAYLVALQVLEAAKKYNSPVMIQFSNGGAQYYAGKSLPNPKETLDACVLGAVAVRLRSNQDMIGCIVSNICIPCRRVSDFASAPSQQAVSYVCLMLKLRGNSGWRMETDCQDG
jgi:hypothetical protein